MKLLAALATYRIENTGKTSAVEASLLDFWLSIFCRKGGVG